MFQVAALSLLCVCCFLQLDTELSFVNLKTDEELTLQMV